MSASVCVCPVSDLVCSSVSYFTICPGLENSTGSHFCPSLTFDVGNQDGASGTVAAAELHFDFVISPTDVFFLDTYSFRIYQEFFDGSRALVNFATITATSQHMCLDITPALRTSQEGRLQTMTIIIDVLLNGVLNCSASMSSLVHLQTGNSTNVTSPFQPFGSSTTVFAFYQMSQTMPFFSRLFRQASDINLYRAVPPESWSRRDVERCRVHRFTLDITPIGAVSPANITFGICSGTCYSPLIKPVPFTHNAQLRSLLNAYDYVPARDRPIMPCCSPAQDSHFEGQSVIVSEPDGKMVIKFLGDLIPTRCGCF